MLKQRLEAANDVARKLVEAERAIENAIAATGVLAGALAPGQARAGLSAVAADPAYSRLAVVSPHSSKRMPIWWLSIRSSK